MRMGDFHRQVAAVVGCPSCGVGIGELCVKFRGRQATWAAPADLVGVQAPYAHSPRINEWYRVTREVAGS